MYLWMSVAIKLYQMDFRHITFEWTPGSQNLLAPGAPDGDSLSQRPLSFCFAHSAMEASSRVAHVPHTPHVLQREHPPTSRAHPLL